MVLIATSPHLNKKRSYKQHILLVVLVCFFPSMWRVCCTLDTARNRIPPSLCGRQVAGSKGPQISGGIKRFTDRWWDQNVYTSWWPTLTEDLHTKDEFM